MVSPPGTKGDQAGIWQSEKCLQVLAGALGNSAAAQGAGAAEDAPGANCDCFWFVGSAMKVRDYH